MHIPDGFLSIPTSLSALAGCGIYGYIAHRKVMPIFKDQEDLIPLVGCTAGLIFATQMLNFPILYGTSGHFLGATFATSLFGPWISFFIMSIVLLIQAVFFGDGGILALGANILCMGIVAPWVSHFIITLFGHYLHNLSIAPIPQMFHLPSRIYLFMASFMAIIAAATTCSLLIASSGTIPLNKMLPAMLFVHALIGIGEGIITATALLFLQKFKVVKKEELFYATTK